MGNSKGRSTSAGEYNGKPLCWKALVGAGRIPKVGLWGKWQALRSTTVRTHVGIFQTTPRIDYVVLMTGLSTDRKLRLGVGKDNNKIPQALHKPHLILPGPVPFQHVEGACDSF